MHRSARGLAGDRDARARPLQELRRQGRSWAAFDWATCVLTRLPAGFNEKAPEGARAAFSPSGKLVAIERAEGDPSTEQFVDVYASPGLRKLKTVQAPDCSAKWGNCTFNGISDGGEVLWGYPGNPCAGETPVLERLGGVVFGSPTAVVVKKEPLSRCPEVADETDQELAHLDFGVPEEGLRVVFAEPGRMIVLAESRGGRPGDLLLPSELRRPGGRLRRLRPCGRWHRRHRRERRARRGRRGGRRSHGLLNLNVHFHCLLLDGVYAPWQDEVQALA